MTDDMVKELAAETGFDLSENESEAFNRYYEMLIEKNKVMNLTAITGYEDVVVKHFIDSLLVKRVLEKIRKKEPEIKKLDNSRIADVGTGAGFPGIPLKICNPLSEMILIDSLNKRIKFLNEIIDDLQLEGISAVHGRCEDIGHMQGFREGFDLVLSRAVADLSVLSEYCLPLVKTGGLFVAYKAEDVDAEAASAEKWPSFIWAAN